MFFIPRWFKNHNHGTETDTECSDQLLGFSCGKCEHKQCTYDRSHAGWSREWMNLFKHTDTQAHNLEHETHLYRNTSSSCTHTKARLRARPWYRGWLTSTPFPFQWYLYSSWPIRSNSFAVPISRMHVYMTHTLKRRNRGHVARVQSWNYRKVRRKVENTLSPLQCVGVWVTTPNEHLSQVFACLGLCLLLKWQYLL